MLGARIALLRRESGGSQKELAGHLEISPSAVGMYEQGRREPSNALLLKMARLFGVSADFLLTGASTPADAPTLRALLHSTEGLLTSSGGPVAAEDRALLLCALLGDLTQGKKSSIIDSKGGAAMTDEEYMRQAIALAGEAADEGEVPVGCIITDGERIVGRGRNRRETGKSALAHAELEAIAEACATLGGWRLWRCTLYVTLEPCPMCAGAIINARIPRVVYGAPDQKAGSCGTLVNLFTMPYNHHPEVTGGVLEDECRTLLQDFFRRLRANPVAKQWDRSRAAK